ncbi:serine/threonine-protein kinase [Roseisolibacter sp. H3M3-2]|uniref:serine/threonine-protein kinase n=1 Tax=Roseisolibacter sp. H3M3-2 TaxID=3031323 RepID=UPI0023DB3603|nr:serine/threonine-protein kinase [Roseisolibacter sp. H3M3-2]MDF1504813.1 serine/threonine-protein kinase [Roseisolibacter sp. H3M3-2]
MTDPSADPRPLPAPPSGHEPAFVGEFPALAAALAGQLRVLRELGRGGMGVVFLARDEPLDRLVALKVLPAALAAQPATRERFLREARTAARLAHPNVVPVYRADAAGGTAYFTMAFVDGESLADRLRDRGPLPAADAVPILRDVAYALAYAHARGVVHRDVKPENILLERATRRTLVTDFGIARPADGAGDADDTPAPRLTQDGHVLGTVHYMSPEQVQGEPLDGRSDLYALGVVAYQLLSGRLPFEGMAAPGVLVAHATRPAPPLRQAAPHVPAALAAVVDGCLAKSPDARPASGEALADALSRALSSALARPPPCGAARRSCRPTRCAGWRSSTRRARGWRPTPRAPTRRRAGTPCATSRRRRSRRGSPSSTSRSRWPSCRRARRPRSPATGRGSRSARRRCSWAPTRARWRCRTSSRRRRRARCARSAACCSRRRSSCGCRRRWGRTRSTAG